MIKEVDNIKVLEEGESTKIQFDFFLEAWFDKKVEIEQKTSGSTGSPKIIKISKSQMIASAKLTGDFFNLKNCTSSLLCINPDYIGGKMLIIRSLLYKLKIFIAPTSSNPIKNLKQNIDFAAMVPLQVATILKENPEKLNLIKYLIIGGAPVSLQLEKDLQKVKCKAYSTFGMTETISHIALRRLDDTESAFNALGETWFEKDNEGQLIIHAPNLNVLNLKTNDSINLLNSKEFKWLGRTDFVINSGGIKLHPEKIEKIIQLFTPKSEVIVTGIEDAELGKKLILLTTGETINFNQLKNQLIKHLHPYEIPKEHFHLKAFSYTDSGKIDRKVIGDAVNW